MLRQIKYLMAVAVATSLACAASVAKAQPAQVKIPGVVHYQARLMDADGKPLNGEVSVRMFVYDSATEGASGDLDDAHLIYAEDLGEVNVVRGRLAVSIGTGEALGPFAGSSLPARAMAEAGDLYLEIEIEGEALSPRKRAGFARASYGAAYAGYAEDLAGAFTITTGSFPDDLPASKIDCSGSNPTLSTTRFSSVPVSNISGMLPEGVVPPNIPLSKLSGGTLAADLLPNVSATSVQSGTFDEGRLPSSVLAPGGIEVGSGMLASGDATSLSGTNCHCIAALHTTTGGGAEGMNTVDIEMNPSGGAVTCNMTFEEGGQWSKNPAPECSAYPDMDSSNDPQALCTDYCVPGCCAMPSCLGPGEQECVFACRMPCVSCYVSGNVSLPCNISHMCVCIN